MTGGLTFQNILPLILALLLIFIVPMILSRYGLDPGDLWKMVLTRFGKADYSKAKRSREPWQTNSKEGDIRSLVSTLLIFVRRNHLGLVYPGTVVHKGRMAPLVALLVTKEEVIGINCFGYGGTITEEKGRWNQHMNGNDLAIESPVEASQRAQQLVRAAMDEAGLKDIPLRVLSVFTSRTVTIRTSHRREVFDTEGLLTELTRAVREQKEAFDPEDISRRCNALVQRVKKGEKAPGA